MASTSPARRRRARRNARHEPSLSLAPDDSNSIGRLITRAQHLRHRMELACTNSDVGVRLDSSTALELDLLSCAISEGDVDTDVLFASLFFDQEGVSAVAAARQRSVQSLQELRDAQDQTRKELDKLNRDADDSHFRLRLVKIDFDRRFPFATSSPTIQFSFQSLDCKHVSGTMTKTVVPINTTRPLSRLLFAVNETFSVALPKTVFDVPDSFLQFTVRCDCQGPASSRPLAASMSGLLALFQLDQNRFQQIRNLDLASRNRQYCCTLQIELAVDDALGPALEPAPEPASEPAPKPAPALGLFTSVPQAVVQSEAEPVPNFIQEVAVRTGDLVVIQVGIRSGIVTPSCPNRLPYLYLSYEMFPGATRIRTSAALGRCAPVFNHLGQIPRLYSDQLRRHLQSSQLVLELWSCSTPGPRINEDRNAHLLGSGQLSMDTLLGCLRPGQFSKHATGDVFAAVRLCGFNGDVNVSGSGSGTVIARVSVVLALGSMSQMCFLGDLLRAAIPIQRHVRGFLCRRRLPRRTTPVRHPLPEPERFVTKPALIGKDRSPLATSSPLQDPGEAVGGTLEPNVESGVKLADQGPYLVIECHQAANVSDPELVDGSLYVRFWFDPTLPLPFQSGHGSTGLVSFSSDPSWKLHLSLHSKVTLSADAGPIAASELLDNVQMLPDADSLLCRDVVFALNYRPVQGQDRCLGRARFSLNRLLADTADDTVSNWLDIFTDLHQCIGHLLVRIAPDPVLRATLLDSRSRLAMTLAPVPSAPSLLVLPSAPMPSTASWSRAAFDETLFDLDFVPILDLLSKPAIATERFMDYDQRLQRPDGIDGAFSRPSDTMQDLNLRLKELEDIHSRLLKFDSQSSSTDRAALTGSRRRAPLIFTPNPATSRQTSPIDLSKRSCAPARVVLPAPSSPIRSVRNPASLPAPFSIHPSSAICPQMGTVSPPRHVVDTAVPLRFNSDQSPAVKMLINVQQAGVRPRAELDRSESLESFRHEHIDIEIRQIPAVYTDGHTDTSSEADKPKPLGSIPIDKHIMLEFDPDPCLSENGAHTQSSEINSGDRRLSPAAECQDLGKGSAIANHEVEAVRTAALARSEKIGPGTSATALITVQNKHASGSDSDSAEIVTDPVRLVREVALSPIRIVPECREISVGPDPAIPTHSASEPESARGARGSDYRSRSASPTTSVKRRVHLSYSTSTVTSQETSPGLGSDHESFQSEISDPRACVLGGIAPQKRFDGLPPLPPRPRSISGQRLTTSADERKRYERIAQIFQGSFQNI